MQLKGTYKEIWQISYPIFLGNLAHSINQVIDAAYLGNYSKIALDAVTLAGIYFFNITFIAAGFSRGCQIMIARYAGQKNDSKIGTAFDNLVITSLGLIAIIILFLIFGTEFLVTEFVQSEAIQTDIKTYLNVMMYGTPFVVFSYCFNGFFAGIGKTKIISVATLSMALTNIFLAYAMVFGHFGFERMGILGAGISTVIAELVMFLVYLSYFILTKYPTRYNALKFKTISSKIIFSISRLATPIVLQGLIGITSWQYFFISIEKLGEDELAVSGILKTLFVFLGIPVWSVASTSNTIISNIIGQRKFELVIPALKRLVFFTMSISLTLNLIILLFPSFTIGVFTNDAHLLEASIAPFYTLMFALMFFSSGMIMNQGIIGTGSTRIPAIVELFCCLFYISYCYYFIVLKKSELQIAWGCEVVYWLSLLVFTLFYWSTGLWKKFVKSIDDDKNLQVS